VTRDQFELGRVEAEIEALIADNPGLSDAFFERGRAVLARPGGWPGDRRDLKRIIDKLIDSLDVELTPRLRGDLFHLLAPPR
jgi:hypothetical protein